MAKDLIEYYQNTLSNYFFLLRQELDLIKEIEELRVKLEMDQIYIPSKVDYDKPIPGNGCSVSAPPKSSLLSRENEEYIDLNLRKEEIVRLYKELDKSNRIDEKLKKLNKKDYEIIFYIYYRQYTLSQYAEEKGISKQAMSYKLQRALERFIEL